MFSFTKLLDQPGPISKVVTAPGDIEHLYVVQKAGRILKLNRTNYEFTTFLDLTDRVDELHSLAFHPQFNEPGSFQGVFVTLEVTSNSRDESEPLVCIVQRRISSPELESSEVVTGEESRNLLCLKYHDRGTDLTFAPDGNLWIGTSDCDFDDTTSMYRRSQDQMELRAGYGSEAQDLHSLYGKLLRIRPPSESGGRYDMSDYSIHPNERRPDERRPEIMAWGFRHPRQITFDPRGNVWVADIGVQVSTIKLVDRLGGNYVRTERNHIPSDSVLFESSGQNGPIIPNYGWPGMNGNRMYDESVVDRLRYDKVDVIPAIISYEPKDIEMKSLISGVMPYHGIQLEGLIGKIVITNMDGRIIVASPTPRDGFRLDEVMQLTGMPITSLNQDERGELYISVLDTNRNHGIVLRMDPVGDRRPSNPKVEHIPITTGDWIDGWPFWLIIIIIVIIIVIMFMVAYARIPGGSGIGVSLN